MDRNRALCRAGGVGGQAYIKCSCIKWKSINNKDLLDLVAQKDIVQEHGKVVRGGLDEDGNSQ